jgi:predicted dehydrogenase
VVDAGVARNADLGTYESMGEFQWRTRAGDIHIPRIAMQEPLLAEMTEFGEACRTGRPPRTDGAQGVDVVRVLTAIDESSARRGAPVKIEW